MIKLRGRENMKLIAKFLLAVFSFAPMVVYGAPVSQTAGSNLTGYNGSMGSVAGNQWNSMMNPRQNTNSGAKADYGNCNAVILRCATPKCAGGGCTEMDVARPIVAGCVSSNATCKKHGDGLIDAVAGQLVASSVATANKQAAQAAAAASQSSANQSAQQIADMQRQMAQMQQENNEKLDALQSALEESQRANEQAKQQVESTPTSTASSGDDIGANLTDAQKAAVQAGVDTDTVQRATVTGQILTAMEGVDASLEHFQSSMRTAFKYGGCNEITGNGCTGPKRVKKFKELAMKVMEPYDSLVKNLEDSLIKAQTVGVDMNDIYMMLSGSCNRWGKYLCRYETRERIVKETVCVVKTIKSGSNNAVSTYHVVGDVMHTGNCTKDELSGTGGVTGETQTKEIVEQAGIPVYNQAEYQGTCCTQVSDGCTADDIGYSRKINGVRGKHECTPGQVIPPEDLVACTVNEVFDAVEDGSSEKITQAWLNPDQTSTGSIRIGCASDVLKNSIFKTRGSSSRKQNSNFDINALELLINQDAPNKPFECLEDTGATQGGYKPRSCQKRDTEEENKKEEFIGRYFCSIDYSSEIDKLKKATITKNIQASCCDEPLDSTHCIGVCEASDWGYVNPLYALCNVHAYNINKDTNVLETEDRQQMKEVIGLKTTVIAQQIYKQYNMLDAMVKRLKIQLEKAALKADLQVAAGGVSSASKDDDSGSVSEFATCSAIDEEAALTCLRENYAKLQPLVDKKNTRTSIKNQLEKDANVLDNVLTKSKNLANEKDRPCKKEKLTGHTQMKECLDKIAQGINELNRQINSSKNSNKRRVYYDEE